MTTNELRTKRGLPEIGVPATDDAYIDAILAADAEARAKAAELLPRFAA